MKTIFINARDAGRRLDKYLLKLLPASGKNQIYKALRKKNIKLNGKRAAGNELLSEGDELSLYFFDDILEELMGKCAAEEDASRKADGTAKKSPFRSIVRAYPSNGILDLSRFCDIVYEDENIILADKRAGVLSQKAGPEDISLNEALLSYCGGGEDPAFTPSVCNRIDMNTTGLVSFAKNYASARELSDMFKDRSCGKFYLAVVKGSLKGAERRRARLTKDEKLNKVSIREISENSSGADIETAYEYIAKKRLLGFELSLIKAELLTGRSHQLRAHLAYLGHPIAGDSKYGDRALNAALRKSHKVPHQLLHSHELRFPESGLKYLSYLQGKSFKAEPPAEFKALFGDMS